MDTRSFKKRSNQWAKKLSSPKGLLVSGLFFVLAFALKLIGRHCTPVIAANLQRLSSLFWVISYCLPGFFVLRKAYLLLKQRNWMNEYFLMSLATVGAFSLGEFAEGAAVMLFYMVGETIQDRAVSQSKQSIQKLMEMAPQTATRQVQGEWVDCDPSQVEVGDRLLIRAGQRVPVDCVILEGIGELNESALTGEATPKVVEPGYKPLSGVLNRGVPLIAQATATAQDSTFSRLLAMTEEASGRKAKSDLLMTRFARFYTPGVVIASVLLVLLTPLLFPGKTFLDGFRQSLNLLVVSCPCAFVLSVPLSYFCGLGKASQQGIFIKGSDCIEQFARCQALVYDKTGTLTTGELELWKVTVVDDRCSAETYLALAAQMEDASEHPLARALRSASAQSEEAAGSDLEKVGTLMELDTLEERPGRGLVGSTSEGRILLGNDALIQEFGGLSLSDQEFINYEEDRANTSAARLLMAWVPSENSPEEKNTSQSRLLALFYFKDSIKSEAPTALESLRQMGIQHQYLLSGDQKAVCQGVAAQLSLTDWKGEQLPWEKEESLENWLSETHRRTPRGTLAFVGDGVNDAPSLSLADVGIAMGDRGSDTAIEAADIVLMQDNLEAIPQALKICRQTQRIALENIAFALLIKLGVILLNFLGIGNLWGAVFADIGVTILCIGNALRLTLQKSHRNLRVLD